MIWWFYRSAEGLQARARAREQADELLRARFDRIFKRGRTGYATLDRLLKTAASPTRTHSCACSSGRRFPSTPTLPKTTSAPSSLKRKISGGTVSDRGRDARDIMLGLAKTCMKLKLSFYEFFGDRLGIPGAQIPHLAELIRPAPS